VTARDLAAWAADAFAGYDVAATHRIVTAATGPGPRPDYVSARVDEFTGTVVLPRPVGVVLARVSAETLDEVVRRVLLTRNALLISSADDVTGRVAHMAARAGEAGAPAGLLQMLDGPGPVDFVLDAVAEAPVVVIVDGGDLAHAIRLARTVLRETGGDRVRVHSADPGAALRVAAALPVSRVAVGDQEMPPAPPDGLVTWTRISAAGIDRQPWETPRVPVPAYPYASNEAP
jgi:acyl-CoA reductase-like NAD-dependent aldehyde dehydrogenase